jgi:hypothetical protein
MRSSRRSRSSPGLIVVLNLLVDLAYFALDPRVRDTKGGPVSVGTPRPTAASSPRRAGPGGVCGSCSARSRSARRQQASGWR